eukprot:gene17556-27027_t
MTYRSTRGGCEGVSFATAVTTGYAPDGGLYVPDTVPVVSKESLLQWSKLSYADLAFEVLKPYVGEDISDETLRQLLRASYSVFPDEVVPVKDVGTLKVAELFKGPTHCFKDLSMQLLIRFLGHFSEATGKRHTIVVSTTGDTGPAAVDAVSRLAGKNTKIHCFYPHGHVSRTQMLQMTTAESDCVRVEPFEGGGDDMDAPIKRIQQDTAFAAKHGIMGCNSYNVARPLIQAVHYFWVYFRSVSSSGRDLAALPPLTVVLPVGALGNLAGGLYARKMGIPLQKFVGGCNVNDITFRVITSGEFHRADRMLKTVSDAINIQVPYNWERIMYYHFGEDPRLIKEMMTTMENTQKVTLTADQLAEIQRVYASARVTDEETLATIKHVYEAHGYLICPHTAVAFNAAKQRGYGEAGATELVTVLATASPCKFQEAVEKSVGAAAWKQFKASAEYPDNVRFESVSDAQLHPRIRYKSQPRLEDAQAEWEQLLRQQVEQLNSA